jgi:predicted transcriptional regulator of viral defense system
MPIPGSLDHATYKSGLSQREVALIAGWERDRRKFLSSDEIRAAVGAAAAAKVTFSLLRKGVLERVERGVYLIRPVRSLLRPTSPSAPMVLAAILHAEPYYLGGLWALTQHGLTDQQYVSVLDAFVTRVRPGRNLAGAKVVFHAVPPRAMEYGVSEVRIEEVNVRVSDAQRTLLDVLDYPRMVGGLRLAVGLVAAGISRVDLATVVEYGVRGSRSATCQRLGVLLERVRAPEAVLRKLSARLEGPRPLTSMVPGPRKGRVNSRWSVVENDRAMDAAAAP